MSGRRSLSRRWRTLAMLLVAIAAICGNDLNNPVRAQSTDHLASVAFLEGGTWLGEGKWPDGSALRVEVRYFWGPTRRVLHFETYDLAKGERQLLYEGLLFFDVKRGKLVQYNFKPKGELEVSELLEVNSKGYEVQGENTRSLVQFTSPTEFRWELRVLQAGEWKVILEAKYRRRR